MIKLEDENGTVIFSKYGNCEVLVFKGDNDFINRWYNLCYNFSITNKKLYRFLDIGFYISTTENKIIYGLANYFYGQIIINNEIPIKQIIDKKDNITIEYDENLANKMAAEKAVKFWTSNIIKENLLMDKYKYICNGLEEYHVNKMKKAIDF